MAEPAGACCGFRPKGRHNTKPRKALVHRKPGAVDHDGINSCKLTPWGMRTI
jgi:hypothetical protein